MGLFGPRMHKIRIKLDGNDATLHKDDEDKTTREVDKNFLDEKWWETATPKDVEAEIKKGADVNAVFYSEYGTKTGENPLSFAIKSAASIAFGTNFLGLYNKAFNDEKITKEDVTQLVYSQFKEKITSDKAEEFQTSIKKSFNESGVAKKISEDNIRTLIKYGANINAIYGEALNDICFDYNLDILNILIENGLDVNQNVSFLFTDNEKLIKIAARRGQEKFVKRLLEAGAKDTRSFMEKIKTHLG